ncbi:unnamed protein product [Arctia plantaginis]|uniref:Uncharacterized protein n=1 Tax=Arctia plantaginis TaxID=874455 RepID=A0A8S0Z1F1_ARCPL|nr:unnamed protein product [Arctia plantaginis]
MYGIYLLPESSRPGQLWRLCHDVASIGDTWLCSIVLGYPMTEHRRAPMLMDQRMNLINLERRGSQGLISPILAINGLGEVFKSFDKNKREIDTNGKHISCPQFEDDIVLVAESLELGEILLRLNGAFLHVGFSIS